MVYPLLLPLMRTPRLPVVDWTYAPCQFKWTRPFRRKTKSGSARVSSHFKRILLMMMQPPSICRTAIIMHRCWSILLNYWSKEALNTLRNLKVSLRRRTWRFWSWQRAFDVLNLGAICSTTLIGTRNYKDQTTNYDDACLLAVNMKNRLQCLVSSFHFHELLHRHR